MGSALSEAERSTILEELARGRFGDGLAADGVTAHRRSPSCGDEFTVQLAVDEGVIREVRWEGHGCVVSTAATATLAQLARGLRAADLAPLASRYLATLPADGQPDPSLGDAEVFAGIGRYPLRASCAALGWRTALDALARL